jgi:AcrR family transcriptional regulator
MSRPTPRPPRRRRRGETLERAIHQAALAELADTGYARLTFEHVAARAGASRMSLYRRWPTKQALVLDTLDSAYPDLGALPDTGNLRTDLLACLAQMAAFLAGPGGRAVRSLIAEPPNPQHNALADAVRQRVLQPRLDTIRAAFVRAADRGEIPRDAPTPLLARTGPALVFQHLIFHDAPPQPDDLAEIVDHVLLPLTQPRQPRGY